MLRSEGELLRAAEEYRNVQQQKQVKNSFSCKGLCQASMEELASILDQREMAMKQRGAMQRHVDINRVGVDKSSTPLVALSTTESILRGDFPFDSPGGKTSSVQDAVAAVSIDAMCVLQDDVTQLFRSLLLRARFERRISAAKAAVNNRGRRGDGSADIISATCFTKTGPLVSLSMINVASSPTAAASGAFLNYALDGSHSNYVIEGGIVLEEAAPIRKAADFGHFFSAVRLCELAGESSVPKKAKEPLQFKLKSYRFHPNAEGGTRIPAPYMFSFPANPLLQTTSSFNDEPSVEPSSEKVSKRPGLKGAHVPPIEHFVQPLATLETFPFRQPQISGFVPRAPHVEATSLCPQTDHIAPGPSVTANELAAASHQTRVSSWTSAPLFASLTSSSNPCPLQEVSTQVQPRLKYVPIASPESLRDALDHFDPLDELSDSDDDGDVDVAGGAGPKYSVGGLLQNGLPSLSPESPASVLHRTFWVPRPHQI